jgi:hypothetical protein
MKTIKAAEVKSVDGIDSTTGQPRVKSLAPEHEREADDALRTRSCPRSKRVSSAVASLFIAFRIENNPAVAGRYGV